VYKNIGILSMARTPIGSFGGTLKPLQAYELGTLAVQEAISRSQIPAEKIDEVLMGCVGQYGLNLFLGRMVGQNAGLPHKVTGQTINRMCASGLQAIASGADYIASGHGEFVVAGGAESMSNYPYSVQGTRWGLKMGNGQLQDDLLTALIEPFTGTHIGITSENIAKKYGITREAADSYALESQRKAAKAIAEGKFNNEIFPVKIPDRKNVITFEVDEYPRETSLDKLATLRPVFDKAGVTTAGNASGVNDGAAAVVMADTSKTDVQPLAYFLDYAVAGVDPSIMGMGPVFAVRKLLERTGLSLNDIGLFELNEAFAVQALACVNELGIDPDKVNVNGSGISLGHPIGATGAVCSIKLISEMHRRNIRYGITSLCIGGGQGMAALFEVKA